MTITVDDVLPGIGNNGTSTTFNVTLNQDDDLQLANPIAVLDPVNQECGSEAFSAPTATDACGNLFSGVPFPASGSTNLGPPMGAPGNANGSYPNDVSDPVNIPDNDPIGISFELDITGDNGHLITDVTVDLDVTHTWVGDLKITMISPSGTEIDLMDRPGVPPFTFGCSGNNLDLIFDDGAANTSEDLNDENLFDCSNILLIVVVINQ